MKNKDKHNHVHHEHHHSHIHHDHAEENIKSAFFLNLLFAVNEIIGGFITNSVSILSDAIHDFGDSLSIGISYLLEKKSKKGADEKYSFGYLRYSLIGAFITSFVLTIGSILIIIHASDRLFNPQEVNHDVMIIFAIAGVLINGYAAFKTSKGKKINEKNINLHMLEDALGWIAVLIGSICIKLFGWIIIDPILSILIALFILLHVIRNINEVFDIFMDKIPNNINVKSVRKKILDNFNSVKDIHHIHIWSLDGINNCMTCHLKLNIELSNEDIITLKNEIKEFLNDINIQHVTLEIEFKNEECIDKQC